NSEAGSRSRIMMSSCIGPPSFLFSFQIECSFRIDHDPDNIGLFGNLVSRKMWNTDGNDHNVAGDIFLRGIAVDLAADTGSPNRFDGIGVGIVFRRVLQLASDQERP